MQLIDSCAGSEKQHGCLGMALRGWVTGAADGAAAGALPSITRVNTTLRITH